MSYLEPYEIDEQSGRLSSTAGNGDAINVEGVDEITIQFYAGVGGDYDFQVSIDGDNWILVAEELKSTHLLLTSNDSFAVDVGGIAGQVVKCIPRPCAHVRFVTAVRGTDAGGCMIGARYTR